MKLATFETGSPFGTVRRIGAVMGSGEMQANSRIVDLNTRLSRRFNPPDGVQFIGGTEAWSPNGDWIAVIGIRFDDGANQTARPTLYRVSVRTGSVRQLAQLNACGGARPEWSHDSLFLGPGIPPYTADR